MARNRGKTTNHLFPAYDKVWREVDVANGAWSLICRENPHRRCLTFQNRDVSHPMEFRSGDGKDIGFEVDKFATGSLGASWLCFSEMHGNLDEQAWYARGQSDGATVLVIEASTNGLTPPAPPCDQSSSSSSSSSTASSSSSSTESSSSSSSPSSSSTAAVNSSSSSTASSSSSSTSASSTSLSSTSSRSSSSSTTGAQNSSSSSDIYPSSSSSSSDV